MSKASTRKVVIMNDFLLRMKRLQKKRNTSEFARVLGVRQQTLDNYMKGINKPSVEFIVTVCVRMGVSSDWLLGLCGDSASADKLGNAVAGKRENGAEDEGENGQRNDICLECAKKDKTIAELAISVSRLTGRCVHSASPPETESGGEQLKRSRAG